MRSSGFAGRGGLAPGTHLRPMCVKRSVKAQQFRPLPQRPRFIRATPGNWLGLGGELLVATVAKDAAEKEQWLWTITALKRPKGWLKGAGTDPPGSTLAELP